MIGDTKLRVGARSRGSGKKFLLYICCAVEENQELLEKWMVCGWLEGRGRGEGRKRRLGWQWVALMVVEDKRGWWPGKRHLITIETLQRVD